MDTVDTLAPDTPLADQSLGQIAVALPGATALFRRLKLDFCCGGQVEPARGIRGARPGPTSPAAGV